MKKLAHSNNNCDFCKKFHTIRFGYMTTYFITPCQCETF